MATKSRFMTVGTSFVVPANVSLLRMTATGAGGAGGGYVNTGVARSSGASAGSGEFCMDFPLHVTPGETITVTPGTGGFAGVSSPGGAGGDTTVAGSFGTFTLRGGLGGGLVGTSAGSGGGCGGPAGAGNGTTGATGTVEGQCHWGGGSGNGAVSNGTANPPSGASIANFDGGLGGARALDTAGGGFFQAAGPGGPASMFGPGAGGGNSESDGVSAAWWGAAGGGAGADNGGLIGFPGTPKPDKRGGFGGDGAVLFEWRG